jgi:hypothetical protein
MALNYSGTAGTPPGMAAILLIAALAAPPGPLAANLPPVVGELKAGPTVGFEIAVSHTGTGRVAITGVEAGCGCVRAAVKQTDLQAGERTVLSFAVNTLTQPAGANTWTATVKYRYLADGAAEFTEHALPVRVTATVVREITATPPSVSLSTTGTANTSVVIADTRAKPLTVTAAASSAGYLTATVGPAANGKQTIAIAVGADAPAGHADEVVVLTTDDPAYRELRIPVRISKRAAGSVTASPAEAELKFTTGQDEASTLVVVRCPDGAPVQIAAVETDHPAVKLTWSKSVGSTATVRVTVPASAAGPAEVRVRLAAPAGTAVAVPVTWTVPR